MRGLFNEVATVSRLSSYSGGKASMQAIAGEVEGHFEPVDNDYNNITLNMQGQAYLFMSEGDADIRENDILTIQGSNYGVKGTAPFYQKSVFYLRVILERSI